MTRRCMVVFSLISMLTALPLRAAEVLPVVIAIDYAEDLGKVSPRVGFLGGLRDGTPDELLRPLNISLWRIGHQFRGRVAGGLPAAVDRVEGIGATYKIVMSDLIKSQPDDWGVYEADVKKLVAQAGTRAKRMIWEPVNEPDLSHKPIAKYYELYGHAFKALRDVDAELQICGPSFAFPSYEKYQAFLDFCRERKLECNYLAWHHAGWDVQTPEKKGAKLGRLREFIDTYKDLKIREVHCDEWGGGPEKPTKENPGRLNAGLAAVWFYYLESVYKVDRACRANWGKEDDYLGGIVDQDHRPHPVYEVYRIYGQTKGQTRLEAKGCTPTIGALASKGTTGGLEILLGSIDKAAQAVTIEVANAPAGPASVEVKVLGGEAKADLVVTAGVERRDGRLRIVLAKVEADRAYQVTMVTKK